MWERPAPRAHSVSHTELPFLTSARIDRMLAPNSGDQTFDAVYLVTALGEIPESAKALSEAARVLSPGGRLVVGEFFDRDWIPFSRLRRYADECGLHLDARSGSTLAYLARFRPCPAA